MGKTDLESSPWKAIMKLNWRISKMLKRRGEENSAFNLAYKVFSADALIVAWIKSSTVFILYSYFCNFVLTLQSDDDSGMDPEAIHIQNLDVPISSAFFDNGLQWAPYIINAGAITTMCSSLLGGMLPQMWFDNAWLAPFNHSGNSAGTVTTYYWTGMLNFLEAGLKVCSIRYKILDGTMSVAERDEVVKEFKTNSEVCKVIYGFLKLYNYLNIPCILLTFHVFD
ncbi:unnamed protein product [Vicia faba]|uniref:Uncharacterized protein n=1 Tax=Vicia faba TaxID=3906 RepID=A0AAV0ZNT2_VICFA|nr:unnamed protein product [Vicia faba]